MSLVDSFLDAQNSTFDITKIISAEVERMAGTSPAMTMIEHSTRDELEHPLPLRERVASECKA